MNTCPFCHRPMLSHASPCCNWCGREIPDTAYQQKAEVRREAFFMEQAVHDAVSLARMEALGVDPLMAPLNPLMGLPPVGVFPAGPRPTAMPPANTPTFGQAYDAEEPPTLPEQPTQSKPSADRPPEELPEGRFQHLEL